MGVWEILNIWVAGRITISILERRGAVLTELTRQDDATRHQTAADRAVQPAAAGQHAQL